MLTLSEVLERFSAAPAGKCGCQNDSLTALSGGMWMIRYRGKVIVARTIADIPAKFEELCQDMA